MMEHKGFTLIELLIVIAIIGILVGIALPSYQAHVRKANRIDMQMAMSEMSLVAERQFARQNSYPSSALATGVKYPSAYSAGLSSNASSFTITAEPQGSQSSDECGTMTLDQKGEALAKVGGITVGGCW